MSTGRRVRGLVGLLLARQGARFALLGLGNTAFAYAVFVLLEHALGSIAPYLVVLLLTYLIGVSESFVVQRRLVFRSCTPWLPAYLRFWSVYLVALGANLALLPLLVEALGLPVVVAQGVVLLLVSVGSFLAHRNFSFRAAPARVT